MPEKIQKIVHEENLDSLAKAKMAALCALDKKAEDVLLLDVSQLTSYADFFVICSALSERQVSAITSHVQDELKKAGARTLGTEGISSSEWVLLDFGDVIFHCFTESAREYYDLEGLWIDAKKIEL